MESALYVPPRFTRSWPALFLIAAVFFAGSVVLLYFLGRRLDIRGLVPAWLGLSVLATVMEQGVMYRHSLKMPDLFSPVHLFQLSRVFAIAPGFYAVVVLVATGTRRRKA
ncbi:MAG: hypothetical protein ACLFOY_00140 [Desulfatibacillaceae bacterium]